MKYLLNTPKLLTFLSKIESVAEWLRRWTANPLGFARAGSNPARFDTLFFICRNRRIDFSNTFYLSFCLHLRYKIKFHSILFLFYFPSFHIVVFWLYIKMTLLISSISRFLLQSLSFFYYLMKKSEFWYFFKCLQYITSNYCLTKCIIERRFRMHVSFLKRNIG